MNLQNNDNLSELPIVTFGKYKDKSILELLSDQAYITWLKQQSWFTEQQHKSVYNIIVNQQITNVNSKTPEHNKLQNKFLDKCNQEQLINKLCPKKKYSLTDLQNLYTTSQFINCFGKQELPKIIPNNTINIKFEDKFNWDMVIHYNYNGDVKVVLHSLEDNEINERNNYYSNKIKIIEEEIKIIEDKIFLRDKYDKYMEGKFNDDMAYYLNNKELNEKKIIEYDKNKILHDINLEAYKNNKEKELCNKYKINLKKYSSLSTDSNEKKIIQAELCKCLDNYYITNPKPVCVKELQMPKQHDINETLYSHKCDEYNIKYSNDTLCSIEGFTYKIKSLQQELNKLKYEHESANTTNTEYDRQRKKIFKNMFAEYGADIEKINGQYKVVFEKYFYDSASIYCELKPILSDDYPCVLRKITSQCELLKKYEQNEQNEKERYRKLGCRYNSTKSISSTNKIFCLILEKFTSNITTVNQLKTIFKNSNIHVIFTDELFKDNMFIETINTKRTNNNIDTDRNELPKTLKQALTYIKILENDKQILREQLEQANNKIIMLESK